MSITVAELQAWLANRSFDEVLAMGPRTMLYVCGQTNPPSIEIGLEHGLDCEHEEFYPIESPDLDNAMECRLCGFQWEVGCLDEDDEEA